MCWDAVWRMGDAWYDALGYSVMNGWCMVWCSVMNGWCMSGVMCYGNEWMNEWMNEWINECVGNDCAFCCILSVFVICLFIFSGLFWYLTNKPHIHPRTSVGHSSHRTRLVTLAPNEFVCGCWIRHWWSSAGTWLMTSSPWEHLDMDPEHLWSAMAESCSALDNAVTELYC